MYVYNYKNISYVILTRVLSTIATWLIRVWRGWIAFCTSPATSSAAASAASWAVRSMRWNVILEYSSSAAGGFGGVIFEYPAGAGGAGTGPFSGLILEYPEEVGTGAGPVYGAV